jgi:hypothetical protein
MNRSIIVRADSRLKQIQQNSAAIVRGGELHQKRGQILAVKEERGKRSYLQRLSGLNDSLAKSDEKKQISVRS